MTIDYDITGQLPVPAGREEGTLGIMRKELIAFLRKSKFYRAQRVMKRFPYECELKLRVLLL